MRRFSSFIRFSILSGLALSGTLLTSCGSKGASSEYLDTLDASMAQVPETTELRGVWITNVDSDVLTSRKKIEEMMDYLKEHNFNVIYPVVYNKARTLYPSDVMDREFGIRMDPLYGDRDPLQELIVEAHARGIEVVPWFEFGFATSYNTGGGHIIEKHPEWAALDQDGNLAKKNNFEWMNAFHPDVQNLMKSLVLEVVEKYDIDGIQGDDRLPATPSLAGYDPYTIGLYREKYGEDPPADYKDEQWVRFRADILTQFLADLRSEIKAIDPNVVVSSSPSYYDWSLYEYLQDSYTWTNEGLVDSIHPQAYRREVADYKLIVDDLVENQFTDEQLELLSPGILIKVGPYVATPEYVEEAVAYNRANGIDGEVFFFYPGLYENDNAIGKTLKKNFYQEEAGLPYRDIVWRPGGFYSTFPENHSELWKSNPNYIGLLRRPGGDPETIVWDMAVPATATYDLYVHSLAGPNQSKQVLYRVDDTVTVIDQSNPDMVGWIFVGQKKLKKGNNKAVVKLEFEESDENRYVISGPVMALLNRRESPEAGSKK